MNGTYSVTCKERQVGTARIDKEGLYCRVRCTCEAGDGKVYILYAVGDGEPVRLGIPVPVEGTLRLETRIPIKRFPQTIRQMYLVEKDKEESHSAALLKEGAPVADIANLMQAKLLITPDGAELVTEGVSRHK